MILNNQLLIIINIINIVSVIYYFSTNGHWFVINFQVARGRGLLRGNIQSFGTPSHEWRHLDGDCQILPSLELACHSNCQHVSPPDKYIWSKNHSTVGSMLLARATTVADSNADNVDHPADHIINRTIVVHGVGVLCTRMVFVCRLCAQTHTRWVKTQHVISSRQTVETP